MSYLKSIELLNEIRNIELEAKRYEAPEVIQRKSEYEEIFVKSASQTNDYRGLIEIEQKKNFGIRGLRESDHAEELRQTGEVESKRRKLADIYPKEKEHF